MRVLLSDAALESGTERGLPSISTSGNKEKMLPSMQFTVLLKLLVTHDATLTVFAERSALSWRSGD